MDWFVVRVKSYRLPDSFVATVYIESKEQCSQFKQEIQNDSTVKILGSRPATDEETQILTNPRKAASKLQTKVIDCNGETYHGR